MSGYRYRLVNEDSADAQARIKKIMQMDEEVGKLASATPVMICMSSFLPLGHLRSPDSNSRNGYRFQLEEAGMEG
jgi:hypothetical protein